MVFRKEVYRAPIRWREVLSELCLYRSMDWRSRLENRFKDVADTSTSQWNKEFDTPFSNATPAFMKILATASAFHLNFNKLSETMISYLLTQCIMYILIKSSRIYISLFGNTLFLALNSFRNVNTDFTLIAILCFSSYWNYVILMNHVFCVWILWWSYYLLGIILVLILK